MDFQVMLASFGLLFVMEIGDKTQLAIMSLAARTGHMMPVFTGAVLALVLVTLVGVIAGAIAGALVPLDWLSRIAGAVFIIVGGLMLWASRPGSPGSPAEGAGVETHGANLQGRSTLGIAALSFGLLAVAEMGDKSQIAVVGMTAATGVPLSVFVGASLALAVLALLAALAGKFITRIVPVCWVQRGAAVLFMFIGALVLAGVL